MASLWSNSVFVIISGGMQVLLQLASSFKRCMLSEDKLHCISFLHTMNTYSTFINFCTIATNGNDADGILLAGTSGGDPVNNAGSGSGRQLANSLGGISRQHGEYTSELWQRVLEAAQRWCFGNVFVETVPLWYCTWKE